MTVKKFLKTTAGIALLTSCVSASAQVAAFPGALGFGANVTGGRGGTVYHVTTLADSGAGSFRDAVSHSGRIIVFDVGGYIKLNSAVSCSGNLTIAGQTAPGGGIGFYAGEISFANRSNIICRYIRIRPGTQTSDPVNDDALSLYRARSVILDHCSFEFGPWNNIDAVSDNWQTNPVTEVTFQNCLDADPTGQQFGAHTESVSSTMSWFYSVFANSHNRNPLAKINNVFVNNVLYNCSAGYTTHTSTPFDHDIVNNYFIAGPAYSSSADFPWYQVDDNQSIYYSGNLFDSNEDGALNGSMTTPYWYQGGTGTILSSPWSSVTTSTPTYIAPTAYRLTVSQAGALPRDQIDDLVISQMKTLGNAPTGTGAGTAGPDGSLYTSQTQTGLGNNGYGTINGGVTPIDTDNDGMPDYWEKAVGLNYLSASDAMTIGADGYANIERYINWLADPHALTVTNTPVDVDLWKYTSGFTNVSPIYSVTALSNGVVTLNGGHVAHFTPTANFSGLGAFQFSVTGSDGTAYTNTVAVLMTPQAPPSNLTWRGDGVNNLWAVGSGANFFDGTNLVTFSSGANVTFDDTGSNTPPLNLSGSIPAGTVYVVADNQDYTFSGSGFLSGGTVLYKTGSAQLNLNTTNTFSGGTTIADGVVQVGDGISANGNLAGNITNNDTLIFNNPGALSSSASISGSGVLIKNGTGALTLTGTQTYTNQTIINAGALQFSSLPPGNITNNGSLIFAPGSFTRYSNTISGPGALTASSSTATILSGGNSYAGNTTNNGGFLILSNNAAVGSGTVVYNGGFVVVASGITITNDFFIPGSSANDLNMMATNTGTGIWAGDVTLGGSAQWRPGSDGGTLTFLGNALMGSHIFVVPRGAVQFASDALVSSTISGFLGRDNSGNKRSANITIRDNASVSMAGCDMGGGKNGGSITITIQNNGSLSFGANTVNLHNIANSAAVSTLRLNGGTLTAGGFTKTQTAYTNVIDFNGGVLKAGANNSAFLPAFSVATDAVQSGGAIIDDGGFAITIAAPLIHDPALGSALDGGLIKTGSGALTLNDPNTYSGPTIIRAGTLVLGGATIANPLANTTNIYVSNGATLDATAESPFAVRSGRTLWGGGSVIGSFIISAGAILSPGSNSVGTLTFNNWLTLAAGSTNIFEINHSPLTNDSVKIFGALTNGGTLVINNIGATAFAAGDSFKLFDAASYNGAFATVILPLLNSGLGWNTNALNTSGVISVVSTVTNSPIISSAILAGNNFVFSGTGGVANADFYLLGATNLDLPLSNWTRLLTNQFDSGGNFNLTNPINGTPENFFRLLVP